jgi:hypothetical protein
LKFKRYHAESEERMSAVYQDAYPIKFKAMAMVDAPFLVWYALHSLAYILMHQCINACIRMQFSRDVIVQPQMMI